MANNWRTGIPEEAGQYLVYCDDGIGVDVDDFINGLWLIYGDHVKAWKKIYVPLWLKED